MLRGARGPQPYGSASVLPEDRPLGRQRVEEPTNP
jgi:hypothetical protein